MACCGGGGKGQGEVSLSKEEENEVEQGAVTQALRKIKRPTRPGGRAARLRQPRGVTSPLL